MTKAEQDREKKREWYKSLSEEQQVDYCLYCIEALAFTYRMVETSYCFLTDFRVKASENPSQVNGYPCNHDLKEKKYACIIVLQVTRNHQ